MVPGAGIEPARENSHWFLRPARLPIPPSGQIIQTTLRVCEDIELFFIQQIQTISTPQSNIESKTPKK